MSRLVVAVALFAVAAPIVSPAILRMDVSFAPPPRRAIPQLAIPPAIDAPEHLGVARDFREWSLISDHDPLNPLPPFEAAGLYPIGAPPRTTRGWESNRDPLPSTALVVGGYTAPHGSGGTGYTY